MFKIKIYKKKKKKKNMSEAFTRDMASSDWLKLAARFLFRAQSLSKNKSICDFAGARPQSDSSTLFSKLLVDYGTK